MAISEALAARCANLRRPPYGSFEEMLKATPLTITLHAFPATDYELIMYADNLGSIPPNTALLVITAGTKKYEVRLASSEEKSAAVKFRYEEPLK